MRFAKRWVLLLAAISYLAGVARLDAQVADSGTQLRINLTEPDGFAERWMIVTRVGDGPIPGLRSIESFDSASRTFTFIDARGSEIQILASEIAGIEFHQERAQQNPIAQEPAWDISSRLGAAHNIEVRPGDLQIKNGTLLLKGPSIAPNSGETLEAKELAFEPDKNLFSLWSEPRQLDR